MLNKLTCDLVTKVIDELKKNENKIIINDYLLVPLSENITSKIHPYIVTIFCMYILILILIISIMFILIKNKS